MKTAPEWRNELANITYETLRDWVVYGTAAEVAERLHQLIDELDLSGVILEMNAGGLLPNERAQFIAPVWGAGCAAAPVRS